MALLFFSESDRADPWRTALAQHMPELDVRIWPDVGDPAEVEFTLVWKPPAGWYRQFPNLKAILSLGAGVDHIFLDPDLPEGVPVVRMVDPGLVIGMTEYVLLHVLRYHRDVPAYEALQRQARWEQIPQTLPGNRRVGIMGIGVLGGDAAAKLVALGFDVAGWSRTPKTLPGVTTFDGAAGLKEFLARTEILVCLLPLTPDTEGILNADLLGQLPRGACLINAARGGHLVDDALIGALDSGHLAGATLDVFHQEPMPPDHPFWAHPAITVTPHVAAITMAETATAGLVENIRRVLRGETPENVVNRQARY